MADNETTITPADVKALLTEFVSRERQTYVGMRYVPKFADPIAWDSDTEYEPLTMVTHNDAIYVSKFYVPADVDISETDYWVMWGTFDDAIVDTDMIADGAVTLAKLASNVIASLPSPTDAQVDSAVFDWLDVHPEATTTVQDNSVTDAKLVQTGGVLSRVDDISKMSVRGSIESTNLFDSSNVAVGGYVSWSTGDFVADQTYVASGFIPVTSGKTYSTIRFLTISGHYVQGYAKNVHVAFFNASKEYLSGAYNQRNVVPPASCAYVRISPPSSYENFYFGLKRFLAKPESFGRLLESDYLYDSAETNRDKVLGNHTPNIVDPSAIVRGKYISYATGVLAPADNDTLVGRYGASDFIAIGSHNKLYAWSDVSTLQGGTSQLAFYDSDYQYISGLINVPAIGTAVDIPSGAVYVAVSVYYDTTDSYPVACWSFEPIDRMYDYGTYATIESSEIIVASDGSGNYTTVTDAVSNASSGDIIKVKSGIYDNEQIEAWGKDVSIIGENSLSTIIRNGTNTYETPPLEMDCGFLENITIESYGTGTPSGVSGWESYGMHVEGNGLYNNELLCRNVIFKCAANAGVGMGMRGGCHVSFENCRFESGETYSVFLHDAANINYTGEQHVTFKDCVFYSERASGTIILRIDSQKTVGATVYPEFIGNVFALSSGDTPTVTYTNSDTSSGQASTIGTFNELINFYKVPTSMGNNVSSLNYYS